MAGRPRTSTDPHAARWRTVSDGELSESAIPFPPAGEHWTERTRAHYSTYVESETARLLRAEDVPNAVRLFEYLDRLARMIGALDDIPDDGVAKALANVKAMESMVITLSNHLGIGPNARARLSVKTNDKPGSKLEAFLKNGNGGSRDATH